MPNDAILSGLTDAAAGLIGEGHREDAVMDAMLTLTVTWAVNKEGPREVSRRLYLLALQAAQLADEIEGVERTETAH